MRRSNFERPDIVFEFPDFNSGVPKQVETTLDDYVLTVQVFSYDEVIAASSCTAAGLFVSEDGFDVLRIHMPALWDEKTVPAFLVGQEDWGVEQHKAWDVKRLRLVVLATRVSDMQPLLLYEATQVPRAAARARLGLGYGCGIGGRQGQGDARRRVDSRSS